MSDKHSHNKTFTPNPQPPKHDAPPANAPRWTPDYSEHTKPGPSHYTPKGK